MPAYDPNFFNIDPYYDDYSEGKKFLKMLFRPGVALQARELSQIQSILQNQIERFGNFVLDDGSMVFGGQITEIPTEVAYIDSLSGGNEIVVGELKDKVVSIENDGTTSYAKILYGMKSPVDDSDVIYFQYLSGEGVTNSGQIVGADQGVTFTASITSDVTNGLVILADSGIRYSNGYFVSHDAQRIGVYEEDNGALDFSTPDSSVGFNVKKSIVTSEQDTTLRDPASGFYNFNAPGSDRFKIDLEIAQRSLTASVDTAAVDIFSRTDFIEFIRIVDGTVVKKEKYADLGEIEETFARRTYDESGHYVVDPFELTVIPGPSDTELTSKLDSGKAYVFGYEFETIGSTKIHHDRARGADHEVSVDDVQYGYSLGPYFLAKFTGIADGASGIGPNKKILFDSYSGYDVDPTYGTVDGVRFNLTPTATTKDFIPGLTLYFADNTLDLTGGDYPGASAAIQAVITRVIPVSSIASTDSSNYYTEDGYAILDSIEIGAPFITGNNWVGGVTSSFETTSPFYVAAGASFEAGFDLTFTGSNVSFFATLNQAQFTGGNINTEIGSARIRNIQKFSGSFFKVFLDDVSFNAGKTFSMTKRFFAEGNTGDPAFYPAELPTSLYNVENTSLVFETPIADVVKSIDDFDYMVDITLEDVQLSGAASGGGVEINFGNPSYDMTGLVQIGPNISSSEAFYDIDSSRIVSVFSEDGKIDCEIRINGGTNPKVLTIQNAKLDGVVYSGKVTVVVACQVELSGSFRSKSSASATIDLDFTGPDDDGYYYSYFLSGQNNLTDVYAINSVTPALTGNILDTGQKNTYYDWSRIKIASEPTESSYQANISYFTHSNYGPFVGGTGTNKSYPDYENIPVFESPDGQTISLRNSLDFRAVRSGSGDSFTLTGPYEFPTYVYDGYEQSVDFTYYLPRVDKIVLTKDKTFQILKGTPNEEPIAPSDDPNAMTLYSVRFNPYTFDENDVSVLQEDNRRFTMRDIGGLERRIENLEYYSTLSSLEQDAKANPIYDELGLEIPKKAILVDQFTGTESADVSNQDFYCSIDRKTKELKPPVEYREVGFVADSDVTLDAGLTNNNGIVTFDFTEENFISNERNNSFRYINANAIVDFVGTVKMTPHCDPWFSTNKKPLLKTNSEGENDSWLLGKPSFDMNSDFEERGWFGTEPSSKTIEKKNTTLKKDKKEKSSPLGKIKSQTLPQSNISSSSERKVDTSIVPYCREKTVNLEVKGLKPDKLHYLYFEDELLTPNGVTASDKGEVVFNATIAGDTYPVGKKLFRVLDNDTNSLSTATSSADAIFVVSGSTKDSESTRFTRGLVTKRESSNSENITTNSLTREFQRKTQKSSRLKDNISQLFTVNKDKYSSGVYVSSVDIKFHAWPSASGDFERKLPIKVSIKPVVNGYPAPSKIITETIIYDVESNNTDGLVNFKFDHPVYLEPATYALELDTNSSNIAVKTYVLPSGNPNSSSSERENVLDVNIGSLILPKNIGKTEKLNNEALCFNIKKCVFVFDTSATPTITYENFAFSDESEMNSHLEGSFLDSRYVSVEIGSNTISTRSSSKLPKNTVQSGSGVKIKTKLLPVSADISPALDLYASNFALKKYKTSQSKLKETLPKNIEDDSIEVDGKYRNVTSSRYITKTVKTLESATNVSVQFERRQPPGTQILIYLKKAEANSITPFDDIPYIELKKVSKDPSTTTNKEFIKTEYRHETKLEEFSTFAVKVVFIKNSTSNEYPSIKNLKVVAI